MFATTTKIFTLLLPFVSLTSAQDYVTNPVFEFQGVADEVYPFPIKDYHLSKYPNPKYARSSPEPWAGQSQYSFSQDDILLLGNHDMPGFKGPRRRKRSALNTKKATQVLKEAWQHLLEMPLFCWKIYVNCAAFPNNVCCPVMHKVRRQSNRDKRATTSLADPLINFGTMSSADVSVTSLAQKRQGVAKARSYEDWRPFSPYYIGMPGYSKPQGN